MLKKILIRVGVTAAAFGGFTAPAQANDFCFYQGGDNYVTQREATDEAFWCSAANHWWVVNHSWWTNVVLVNQTAWKMQMAGYNLHPRLVVDWDSAKENSSPGQPLPGGYWVTINP